MSISLRRVLTDHVDQGQERNTATIVHCRVGVSRSATICIAEMMGAHGLDFPDAYTYVRARRLNVIVQPNLRFVYELLQWGQICERQRPQKSAEPHQALCPSRALQRLDWIGVCREIAALNKPFMKT